MSKLSRKIKGMKMNTDNLAISLKVIYQQIIESWVL